jgi:8-oxo-dGTP pyrophosphatase MutT (NUDIX family)
MKNLKTDLYISIDKAKTEKLFYFVCTGTIYHPKKKKCLILKRSEKEIAHPGLWGVTGGKLEWKDMKENPYTRKNYLVYDWEGLVDKLITREAYEESGLVVENPKYISSLVFLRPDNVPVVCFKFGVRYKKGKVSIAPEFDDYAWVDSKEIKKYKTIQGIDAEVAKTIQLFDI